MSRTYLIAIALLLGVRAYGQSTEFYQTLDAAADAALSQAEALAPSFEAGGSIYQCEKGYIFPAPETQHSKVRVDVSIYAINGCTLAALYHTHPKGDSKASKHDIQGTCAAKTVSYIRPTGGVTFTFDCRNMSDGAIQAKLLGR